MTDPEARLAEAFRRFNQGDIAAAEAIGRQLAPLLRDDIRIDALLGLAAFQQGHAADAAQYLTTALSRSPDNLLLRSKLGLALVQLGQLDEAHRVAADSASPECRRIVAYVDHRQGRHAEAIRGYRQVLATFPQDYDSWTNLGILLREEGELGEAIEAFRRALGLRADLPETVIQLSRALGEGQHHIDRQALMRDTVRRWPNDPRMLIELGLAEGALNAHDAAEAAYRRALALAPDNPTAILEFGMMLEALSRLDELDALVARARADGIDHGQLDFLEAWLLKRRGRFGDALALIERATDVNPSRRAQLIGEIADRLGDTDRAFAAFTEMNRHSAAGPASAYARAQDFPGQVEASLALYTPATVATWTSLALETDPLAPIFVLGFPRSGTTLLDTLLMNLPELHVLEEQPMVEQVEALLGDPARLGILSTDEANRLRRAYFTTLEEAESAPLDNRMIVDKFPLHLVRVPLIHRLFPDARIVFVERHPCDVVLSCFISRFQINRAMVQFQDLAATARFYDIAMTAWTRAAELLPLRVHHIRYERMIDDLESEMRMLLTFLDLPWRDAVLDNQSSAARRPHIATASYAQVTEPIYARASGRWERYRHHLEPILPILAPWAKQLGYAM